MTYFQKIKPNVFDKIVEMLIEEGCLKRVDEFFELIEENRSKVNHYFQTVFRTFLRHKQYIKNALETSLTLRNVSSSL